MSYGVGFTIIENDCDGPAQPLAIGVTVTVDTIAAGALFVAVNAAISPVPVLARPMLE